jgi:hypothetical protein
MSAWNKDASLRRKSLSGKRAELGGRCHHPVEHRLSGPRSVCEARARPANRRKPVPARRPDPLEPHQLDWRLQLAAKQTRAEREIQADAAPTHALTYFNFPFVKRPRSSGHAKSVSNGTRPRWLQWSRLEYSASSFRA